MKYEVLVTVWSKECKNKVKFIVGEFDRFNEAKLFSDTYKKQFPTSGVEIVEYERKTIKYKIR